MSVFPGLGIYGVCYCFFLMSVNRPAWTKRRSYDRLEKIISRQRLYCLL